MLLSSDSRVKSVMLVQVTMETFDSERLSVYGFLLGRYIILETLGPPLEFFILVYWKTTSINNVLSISIYYLLPTIGQRLDALHPELRLLRVEEAGQLRFDLSKVGEPLSA